MQSYVSTLARLHESNTDPIQAGSIGTAKPQFIEF